MRRTALRAVASDPWIWVLSAAGVAVAYLWFKWPKTKKDLEQ